VRRRDFALRVTRKQGLLEISCTGGDVGIHPACGSVGRPAHRDLAKTGRLKEMRSTMIPVSQPLLCGNEAKYLAECIESGWISSEGPFVRKLEEGMAALCGQQHGIAVMNGSAALEVAVASLGIGPGDEVILPTFTIISCAAAIVRSGATPVLVDCEPLTWNMDPDQIESKITPRTKAIMVVHIYGLPVDMDPVMEIASRYGLKIIEDAAEQIGQAYRGKRSGARMVGSFGDVAIFSFYPNKNVTTGEGGMVLTRDDRVAETCRDLRNLCFGKSHRFVHERLGWNFRMSNLQAAVGVAQLEQLPSTLKKKRQIGSWYDELLADLAELERLPPHVDYAENVYWVYGVTLRDSLPFDAAIAMRRLAAKGVGTRPFFWPMHEQPVFRKMGLFGDVSCPVAERIARRGFYLPSGPALTKEEAEQVSEAVREVLQ
jgi:perosamine synthetase